MEALLPGVSGFREGKKGPGAEHRTAFQADSFPSASRNTLLVMGGCQVGPRSAALLHSSEKEIFLLTP
jgi:hypothetical protein